MNRKTVWILEGLVISQPSTAFTATETFAVADLAFNMSQSLIELTKLNSLGVSMFPTGCTPQLPAFFLFFGRIRDQVLRLGTPQPHRMLRPYVGRRVPALGLCSRNGALRTRNRDLLTRQSVDRPFEISGMQDNGQ